MGTLNEDLTAIKTIEDGLVSNKVAKFAYTDLAYCCNCVAGVETYDANNEQNIPVGTASVMKVNDTVLNKGYRAQASSVTRMLLNHFLGRLSYNLNKVNDNVANLLSTLISHRGTANGLATLDANAKVPNSEIPLNIVRTVNGVGTADGAVTITYSDIGLSSTAGYPLGTASAGTMTTPARADHVHPMPTCVECSGCSTYAGRATGQVPFDASICYLHSGCTVRATAVHIIGENFGYTTRVALGAVFDGQTTGCGFSSGILSVGRDDSGTDWNDFYFRQGQGGDVVTSSTISSYHVGNADYATCANYATCAGSVNFAGLVGYYNPSAYEGWLYRKDLICSFDPTAGYLSRVAIGQFRSSGWSQGLISIGCNDSGTEYYNYSFSANGIVNGVVWMPYTRVSCADGDENGININTCYAKKSCFSYSNGVLSITM